MTWIALTLSVAFGAGVFWWLWLIPLPVTIATFVTTDVPVGCAVRLNERLLGVTIAHRPGTLTVQPIHPLRRFLRGCR